MNFYGLSNAGRLRGNNEDCYHIPRKDDPLQNIFIVADGMGGEKAGEVASTLAISGAYTVLNEEYTQGADLPLLVRRAMNEANKVVYDAAQTDKRFSNMGTTMTMALIDGEYITIGNVGDSRAYLLSEGSMKQITSDHSLVQEMVDRGLITQSEARQHPDRNIITRALGVDRFVNADLFTCLWAKGDQLLLATDGLTGMVNEQQISDILMQGADCRQRAQQLIAAANSAGGRDNITVICLENDGGSQK